MSRIVITGAPGAGKTTLLLALQTRGYAIVDDTARTIIRDRRRRGLSPRPDPYAFAQEALRMDIENFVHHAASPDPVFFERGVLDTLCGLDRVTPLNESELSMWLSKYQYFPKVFVLPPWKAIYVNDAERDHTFEHAESVNRLAQEWYRRCGYQVLEVPLVSVDERCTFVLDALANSDTNEPLQPTSAAAASGTSRQASGNGRSEHENDADAERLTSDGSGETRFQRQQSPLH